MHKFQKFDDFHARLTSCPPVAHVFTTGQFPKKLKKQLKQCTCLCVKCQQALLNVAQKDLLESSFCQWDGNISPFADPQPL